MLQATVTGEEHGLIGSLPNSVPDTGYKHCEEKLRQTLLKRDKDDSKTVKARYVNYEEKELGRNKLDYIRAGQPIQQWRFIHGHEYILPMGVVREFNNKSRMMARRSGLQSIDGIEVQKSGAPTEKDTFSRFDELIPVSFN